MRAFQPQGNTYVIAGNSTAPAGVQILPDGDVKSTWYRLFNPDSATAFYAFGNSANAAKNNAVVPTSGAGNQTHAMGLPPLAIEVVCASPGAFVSAITSSGNANIQVTPGEGF